MTAAVSLPGAADVLVTSDADLLALGTFRGTRTLTPRELLAEP